MRYANRAKPAFSMTNAPSGVVTPCTYLGTSTQALNKKKMSVAFTRKSPKSVSVIFLIMILISSRMVVWGIGVRFSFSAANSLFRYSKRESADTSYSFSTSSNVISLETYRANILRRARMSSDSNERIRIKQTDVQSIHYLRLPEH